MSHRIIQPNWYGLDHDVVKAKFEGEPVYCNTFCVLGEYKPSAVYYCKTPNVEKGHKTFMLLTIQNGNMYVRGMDEEAMKPFRRQLALHCLSCQDIVYSVMRHDMRSCSCGKVMIDGGKDYAKHSISRHSPYNLVTIDLITNEIVTD